MGENQAERVDVLVVGSGAGGKQLAWHMAVAGHRTALVERKWIGGSCPNINCLPSKNEVKSAEVADVVHHAPAFGTTAAGIRTDMAKVLARKRTMVEGLVATHLERYRASGTELILGDARFVAAKTVEVHLNDGGTRVLRGDRVFLNLGTRPSLPSIPGLAAAALTNIELLADLPCKKERGRLLVNEFLEVPDWPGVWALGDCALVPDGKTDTFYPPTAQHALRQGTAVAQNLIATIRGGRKKPFVFSTLGQLAAIGRRTGVANIMGINFSGFIAWWLWRTIYLSKLPRFEKKLRVALDWTLDVLFAKDLVQFVTVRAPHISRAEEEESRPSNGAPAAAEKETA